MARRPASSRPAVARRRPPERSGPTYTGRAVRVSDRHPRGRVGGGGRRRGRPARPPAAAHPAPAGDRRRRRRAARRCASPCRARARATSAVVRAADVGLHRDLPDAQRRSRAPARAGARRYPVRVDRALGLGELPGLRLQRALARPGAIRCAPPTRCSSWSHWIWFLVPHGTVAYLLAAPPRPLPARRGADVRGLRPRASSATGRSRPRRRGTPPRQGALGRGEPALRRMMLEHGEAFWKAAWGPLYDVLGGNPLAAMPSLHFATSLMAAHLLREAGPVPGRDRAGRTRSRSASRSSTWASTTSSTSSPARRSPRASAGRAAIAPRRRCARLSRALQRLEARAHA